MESMLECECGFRSKVEEEDTEVTCPKCFMIYKKEKKRQK